MRSSCDRNSFRLFGRDERTDSRRNGNGNFRAPSAFSAFSDPHSFKLKQPDEADKLSYRQVTTTSVQYDETESNEEEALLMSGR